MILDLSLTFLILHVISGLSKPIFLSLSSPPYEAALNAAQQSDFRSVRTILIEAANAGLALNSAASNLLGSASLSLGQYDDAEVYITAAVEASSWSDPLIISNLILALRLNNHLDKAVAASRRAILLYPDNVEIILNSVGVYEALNEFEIALNLLMTAAAFRPASVDVWVAAIANSVRLGQFEKAEFVAARALEAVPDELTLETFLAYVRAARKFSGLPSSMQYNSSGCDAIIQNTLYSGASLESCVLFARILTRGSVFSRSCSSSRFGTADAALFPKRPSLPT
jgi:tetratricopeptide (TPR) repeat protein